MLTTAPLIPTLCATDLERAKRFYGETLGLELVPAAVGALFRTGKGTNLWLYEKAPSGVDLATTHFIVRDIREVMKELTRRGIEFEDYNLPDFKTTNGVGIFGPLGVAWFRDTEGNMLNLMQVVAK
jgi:catechol 2,3-dioxygenase-like lactoylglutathione lyase family enzyme